MSILDRAVEPSAIERFRLLLSESAKVDPVDPAPLLAWLAERRTSSAFSAALVGLSHLRQWRAEPDTGNIVHSSGAFFSIEGVRVRARGAREVLSWDQPIFNQREGGVLALFGARDGARIKFLLNAKAEPGNLGTLQLAPSLQCTWSNLKRAHHGAAPPLSTALSDESPGRLVYRAEHNEEGGRFWRKSNCNAIIEFESDAWLEAQAGEDFTWASLAQIKALALIDNVLSPFVKTIIAPL